MPCSRLSASQAGERQKASRARTAAGAGLVEATEPEKVVMISTALGKPPTMVMPATPRISLSC